jgi:hypothetical protein
MFGRHYAVALGEDEPRVDLRVTRAGGGDEVALKVPDSQAVVNPLGQELQSEPD